MSSNGQDERRRQIEAAAYAVLAEKGYKATSMLVIAKRAAASNETLYRWYGNKSNLFRALVEENAREVRELLERCIAGNEAPLTALRKVGPLLLSLVTSERAVALNRAAVADVVETGTLGQTIATSGKGAVGPLIATIMARARRDGVLEFDESDDPAQVYLSLLIGDLQIKRVIGVCPVLSAKAIRSRADRAYDLVLRLYDPPR